MTVELRRSPLAGAAWGDAATVAIAEVPFTPAVELRGHGSLQAGAHLPEDVGETRRLRSRSTFARRVCCLGPQWWLVTGEPDDLTLVDEVTALVDEVTAPVDEVTALVDEVTAPVDEVTAPVDEVTAAVTFGSAVDVSAQRTRIDIIGPRWADVLRHVWPRDLATLTVDTCAQGLLGRAQALLIREADDRVAVHVRASFARYAYALLTDAATEYA